ncbi:MAG: hypothetical protein SFX74_12570 [Fimbriimonadaceae bacterium]|nr:hypothetical protein [Fimbriimonadaceae bacterium]
MISIRTGIYGLAAIACGILAISASLDTEVLVGWLRIAFLLAAVATTSHGIETQLKIEGAPLMLIAVMMGLVGASGAGMQPYVKIRPTPIPQGVVIVAACVHLLLSIALYTRGPRRLLEPICLAVAVTQLAFFFITRDLGTGGLLFCFANLVIWHHARDLTPAIDARTQPLFIAVAAVTTLTIATLGARKMNPHFMWPLKGRQVFNLPTARTASMIIVTGPGCEACELARSDLRAAGLEVREIPVEGFRASEIDHPEAQLMFPSVIVVSSRGLVTGEIRGWPNDDAARRRAIQELKTGLNEEKNRAQSQAQPDIATMRFREVTRQ